MTFRQTWSDADVAWEILRSQLYNSVAYFTDAICWLRHCRLSPRHIFTYVGAREESPFWRLCVMSLRSPSSQFTHRFLLWLCSMAWVDLVTDWPMLRIVLGLELWTSRIRFKALCILVTLWVHYARLSSRLRWSFTQACHGTRFSTSWLVYRPLSGLD